MDFYRISVTYGLPEAQSDKLWAIFVLEVIPRLRQPENMVQQLSPLPSSAKRTSCSSSKGIPPVYLSFPSTGDLHLYQHGRDSPEGAGPGQTASWEDGAVASCFGVYSEDIDALLAEGRLPRKRLMSIFTVGNCNRKKKWFPVEEIAPLHLAFPLQNRTTPELSQTPWSQVMGQYQHWISSGIYSTISSKWITKHINITIISYRLSENNLYHYKKHKSIQQEFLPWGKLYT